MKIMKKDTESLRKDFFLLTQTANNVIFTIYLGIADGI